MSEKGEPLWGGSAGHAPQCFSHAPNAVPALITHDHDLITHECCGEIDARILGGGGSLGMGAATVALLMGTGIYLSIRIRFTHLRKFYLAADAPSNRRQASRLETPIFPGMISPWQSMMTHAWRRHWSTATSAGSFHRAIAVGGPARHLLDVGCGPLAMAIKNSEAILGLQYAHRFRRGRTGGRSMYYLRDGASLPLLAWLFAFLAGMGRHDYGPLAQTNSHGVGAEHRVRYPPMVSGAAIALAAWLVIIGGIKMSIARFAEKTRPAQDHYLCGGMPLRHYRPRAVAPQTHRADP